MNFRQMTDEQIALILLGLRTIYVHDSEPARSKLIAVCEGALGARGKRLADCDPPETERMYNKADHQVDFQYHRIGRD